MSRACPANDPAIKLPARRAIGGPSQNKPAVGATFDSLWETDFVN